MATAWLVTMVHPSKQVLIPREIVICEENELPDIPQRKNLVVCSDGSHPVRNSAIFFLETANRLAGA